MIGSYCVVVTPFTIWYSTSPTGNKITTPFDMLLLTRLGVTVFMFIVGSNAALKAVSNKPCKSWRVIISSFIIVY